MHWFYDDDATPDEDKITSRNWRVTKNLAPYFKKYIGKIIIASVLLLLSTLFALIGPILIKHAIDIEIPGKNIHGLLIIGFVYLFLQIFIILVRYFQNIEIMTVGERAIADLKSDTFEQLLNLPLDYFDRNSVGTLISRTESDSETLKLLFSHTAVVVISNIALILGMSVVMITVNYRLYLLILCIVPFFLFGFWQFQRSVRPVFLQLRRKFAQINSLIIEALTGINVIQVFNQHDYFTGRMHEFGKGKRYFDLKSQTYWYRTWFLVEIGEAIGIILVIGLGGRWALQNIISIGSLYLFITYITRLFVPLRGLSDQINLMQRSFASAERIFAILGTVREESYQEGKSLCTFNDRVTFKDLGLYYEKEKWVLQNINFELCKGERIALVGETGGGKTSIVSLLLNFYQPKKGTILIDGLSITDIDQRSLRSKIGFVPQDVILFPGSITDNLRLFNKSITAEQVIAAAKRAHIHERIMDLPQHYDTNIVEQGINLSFGERQLLSYTRALVFDPEILILDEATSSVDPESERQVQKGMKELLKDRTAIIIAHRLTTTRLANKVLVIHKGSLIETGTHEELIRKQGHYAAMYHLQYLKKNP
jgi:ATP-binding cassette subfamily B multidrug efflux pump